MRTAVIIANVIGLGLACAIASSQAADSPAPARAAQGQATPGADNTNMNVRDKGGATLTPQKQSNAEEDRKLLAAVRRAVVEDKNLSTAGHNVKIVARDGVVTLRGPVRSEEEKGRIGKLAQNVAGVTSVANQIDIKTK